MKVCALPGCDTAFDPNYLTGRVGAGSAKRFCSKRCRVRWSNRCYAARHKERLREYHREYRRKTWRKYVYGLSNEQYEEMLSAQSGVCAICEKGCPTGKSLAVDHDHLSGRIRGLLCADCNGALGHFKDDPALLRRAIVYLGA